MKSRLGFIAFILLFLLCLAACNNEESNNYEKQREEPVAEESEKSKVEETVEVVETVSAEKTGDQKEVLEEQIQDFFDAYYERERIAQQEFPLDKGKIEDYYKLFSWWSNATADVKEDWLENKSNNASNAEVKTKTTSNLIGILKNTEVAETGEIITEVLIDVAIHGVDEDGKINNTYTDIHHANVMLIPAENEYGWSLYNYNRIDTIAPVDLTVVTGREPVHVETAIAGVVPETEHIAYYQSAVHPQDVVVRLFNANGNTGGDITPYQEGAYIDSTMEYFEVPIYVEVGQTLGMSAYESFQRMYYYRFESLERNKRITEIITPAQEVIGKGKFVAVVTRIDNEETFYILFEGIE